MHLAHLAPPYPAPIAASVQHWAPSTVLRLARRGRVRGVALLDDRSAMQVVDENGLVRRVELFPGAARPLLHELRDAGAEVEILPPPRRAPAPLVALARQVTAVLVAVWILDALGMLWLAVAGLLRWTDAVDRGWNRTLHGE